MGLKRSRSGSLSSPESPGPSSPREPSTDVKIIHLDAGTAVSTKSAVMKCELPPHQPLTFASLDDYDIHYRKTHVNRCSECGNNFPDEHFLHLHIAECHDPINAAKRERGDKTYQCLIPDCDRFCSSPQKRRLHCIDKHGFPRDYDFYIVKDGIDRRSSMLRQERRRSSAFNSLSRSTGHLRRPSTRDQLSVEKSHETVDTADNMVIVHGEKEEYEEESEDDEEIDHHAQSAKLPQRVQVKLHGRGGFGRGRGAGRGHRRGDSKGPSTPPVYSALTPLPDSMDSLTKDMSALKFVPHSVRKAGGRGRGGLA